MRKIKTIIVDDEPDAREGLALLVADHPALELQASCKNGLEALDYLHSNAVDLMFLDVQMPVLSGFEVVQNIVPSRMPLVVFVSAYDAYALKAFEVNALDYLLKPCTDERFGEMVFKVKGKIKDQQMAAIGKEVTQQKEHLQQGSVLTPGALNCLPIKINGRTKLLQYSEIFWIQAYDYYVKIHVKGHVHVVRDSIKRLSEVLPVAQFSRVHKSSIVHLQKIQDIVKLGNGEYKLTVEGQEIKVSRSFNHAIKNLL